MLNPKKEQFENGFLKPDYPFKWYLGIFQTFFHHWFNHTFKNESAVAGLDCSLSASYMYSMLTGGTDMHGIVEVSLEELSIHLEKTTPYITTVKLELTSLSVLDLLQVCC